jgi:RNA polymerase sigma-70 factor, ECF subfamily
VIHPIPPLSEHADHEKPDHGSSAFSAAEAESARLMTLVYDELRALAASWFRQQPANHTLQPTALVHEAYVRLNQTPNTQWRDRTHFFAVAATAMRRILVDHARHRQTGKRGKGECTRITLDEAAWLAADHDREVDILELDSALSRLEKLDQRQCRIVELRFLAGMSVEETAKALGVSARTVKLDWSMARAWLVEQLRRGNAK